MTGCERLGLGTVQWGMSYGVANQTGQAASADVERMLQAAAKAGISLLDTAHAYGEAESVIGRQGAAWAGRRTVTKTRPLPPGPVGADEVKAVAAAFRQSLARLQAPNVYGLMVHHADNLLAPGGEHLWKLLESFKQDGLVTRIGVSVYSPAQLRRVMDAYAIELVQLPLNLYDQRFVQDGMLERLEAAGVEIHTRSAFLQGLLLMPPDRIPDRMASVRPHQIRLYDQLAQDGISPLAACLRFCLDRPQVKHAIVGCETADQLADILGQVSGAPGALANAGRYALSDETIIDPSRWPR